MTHKSRCTARFLSHDIVFISCTAARYYDTEVWHDDPRWWRINPRDRRKWQQLSNRRGFLRLFPCRRWQPSPRPLRWLSTEKAPWTSPYCTSPVQGPLFLPPAATWRWYSRRSPTSCFSFHFQSNGKPHFRLIHLDFALVNCRQWVKGRRRCT